MFFLLGWIYSGGLKGKPCRRGGRPELGGAAWLSAHVFSLIKRPWSVWRGEILRVKGFKGIKLFFHLSQKEKKRGNKRGKENHFIMWWSNANWGTKLVATWFFRAHPGAPWAAQEQDVTAELENSRSTRTEVARMSSLVISHMTSWLSSFLAPPGSIGSRGKRKRKSVKLNIYHMLGILDASPQYFCKVSIVFSSLEVSKEFKISRGPR